MFSQIHRYADPDEKQVVEAVNGADVDPGAASRDEPHRRFGAGRCQATLWETLYQPTPNGWVRPLPQQVANEMQSGSSS